MSRLTRVPTPAIWLTCCRAPFRSSAAERGQTRTLREPVRARAFVDLSLGLRAAASSGLLPTDLCYFLNDLVVDVRISDDHTSTTVSKADSDNGTLFIVGDLLASEVADKDGLACHS